MISSQSVPRTSISQAILKSLFFRQNYKRHTNFSIKPERMDYIGTFGSGNEVSIPIKSKGDLLSYVWIENANINSSGSAMPLFLNPSAPMRGSGQMKLHQLNFLFVDWWSRSD